LWAQYVEEIEAKGQKILASNLNSDIPKLLKDHKIWIELPNDTMKKEIERSQSGVLNFLKKELNNYAISLKITVSEEVAKQFAFTPEEKYEKLREKNPNVDLLRSKLDLDIS
jgi:DNA polymerase-3 subunit gamma/tau